MATTISNPDRPADHARKIDVGGGRNPLPGHTNVDLRKLPEVDYHAPASDLPFADNVADRIHANSLVPHIPDLNAAMTEFSRVLKPGGELVLKATHANSTGIRDDPDHEHYSWTSRTPRWYDEGSVFDYYANTSLSLVDVEVVAWARPEREWLRPWSAMIKEMVARVSPEVADELVKLPFVGGRVIAHWEATERT